MLREIKATHAIDNSLMVKYVQSLGVCMLRSSTCFFRQIVKCFLFKITS
jgi:hypothetical protein